MISQRRKPSGVGKSVELLGTAKASWRVASSGTALDEEAGSFVVVLGSFNISATGCVGAFIGSASGSA